MSTAVVSHQTDTAERPAQQASCEHVVTSGEDAANSATITFAGVGTVKCVVSAQIKSTGNVHRAPQGAVTFTGATVTIADSGLAVGEIILLQVVGYNA